MFGRGLGGMMSEYSFIRGREVLESQGAKLVDAFMEKELRYYDRKGSPFLQ